MPTEPSRYQEAYFTPEGLRDDGLVPRGLPPSDYLAPTVVREIIQTAQLSEFKARIVAWTMAALSIVEVTRRSLLIPGFRFFSFGLADPSVEDRRLAIFAYIAPELFPIVQTGIHFGEIPLGRERFPIYPRPDVGIGHAISLHPGNPVLNRAVGTTGCYARLKSNKRIMLLTAKHVVENLLPNPIAGGNGFHCAMPTTIILSAECTISRSGSWTRF